MILSPSLGYATSSGSSISSYRSRSSDAASNRMKADDENSLSSVRCSKPAVSSDISMSSSSSRFDEDRSILPNPAYNNKRRTIRVVRHSLQESFGFAIQSYVFQRCLTGSTERVTYVDYVRDGSPADKSGIRRGDVIVAVNGVSVVGESHSSLVRIISSQMSMRLVLLFQNIARIVQLSARSLQLQYILKEKELMLNSLMAEEERLLQNHGVDNHLNASTNTTKSSIVGLHHSNDGVMIGSTLEMMEHPEDPLPSDFGLTKVVRVDSHSSLQAQVTRL